MIVVEGPDGAGKTRLCEMLHRDKLVKGVMESPGRTRKTVPLKEQTQRYMRMYGDNPGIAVDRFLFSEMVYGPMFRNRCEFSISEYLRLLAQLIDSHSILVFCIPEDSSQLSFTERQMDGVIDRKEEIFQKYTEYYEDIGQIYRRIYKYNFRNFDSYLNLVARLKGAKNW